MLTELRERVATLERYVAILMGQEDPGIPCGGNKLGQCYGGNAKEYDDAHKWGWVKCPECGGKGRMYPPVPGLVNKPKAPAGESRTRARAMAERRENGCCNRYADKMACDCLKEAARCEECGDSGYAVHPRNGTVRNSRRCSRGCVVNCSICNDPDCDNPGGQH